MTMPELFRNLNYRSSCTCAVQI